MKFIYVSQYGGDHIVAKLKNRLRPDSLNGFMNCCGIKSYFDVMRLNSARARVGSLSVAGGAVYNSGSVTNEPMRILHHKSSLTRTGTIVAKVMPEL
tara:strand:+ start:1654 stop:1944 length:291 start_codon:yes stop_codon:yes gene_type:complete